MRCLRELWRYFDWLKRRMNWPRISRFTLWPLTHQHLAVLVIWWKRKAYLQTWKNDENILCPDVVCFYLLHLSVVCRRGAVATWLGPIWNVSCIFFLLFENGMLINDDRFSDVRDVVTICFHGVVVAFRWCPFLSRYSLKFMAHCSNLCAT